MGRADPTEEQAEFINAPDGRYVLVSCPGSGKTFTGVRRFLSRAQQVKGVAYLSFTRVAVSEARRAAVIAQKQACLLPPNFIGTIDAFIRQHIFDPFIGAISPHAGTLSIITPESYIPDDLDALADVYDSRRRPHKAFGIKLKVDQDGSRFVLTRYNAPLPDGVTNEAILNAKRSYLEAGFATHNDVLLWSLELIRREPLRVAAILAQSFPEIIVDEAQDTSRLQQRILYYIERAGAQISYIGDPLQSIYTFNDADAAILEERGDRLSLTLTRNKRSSSQIVELINATYDTAMTAEFSTRPGDFGVAIVAGTPRDCAVVFRRLIETAGVSPKDAAIIARSKALISSVSGTMSLDAPRSGALKRLLAALAAMKNGDVDEAARLGLEFLRSVLEIALNTDEEKELWLQRSWIFLRQEVPALRDQTVQEWIAALRRNVLAFGERHGVAALPNLGVKLQRGGIAVGTASEMLDVAPSAIRVSTIHAVKGESIDAVLLVGDREHHNAWLQGRRNELGHLGYVGLTRARLLLAIGCPNVEVANAWRERLLFWQLRELPI